ncbi:MAG: hypothetical protein IJ690_07105 [Clostridia bacterium]|nr:hypothetical protein [Clostridia bacterium]
MKIYSFFLSIMRLNISVSLLIGSILAGILSKQGISSKLSQFSNSMNFLVNLS